MKVISERKANSNKDKLLFKVPNKILGLENTVTEVINLLESFNSRLEQAEETINQLEQR